MKIFKSIFVIFLLLFVFTLSSCFCHKADANGPDDFSLTTITTEDILNNANNNVVSGSLKLQKGNNCTVKIKKLSGIDEIFSKKLNNSDFNITVNAEVASGNCRVVLCTKDEIIQEIAVNNGEQDVYVPHLDGWVYLKVAGESAQVKITYNYSIEDSSTFII